MSYLIAQQNPTAMLAATQNGSALMVTPKEAGAFLVEVDPTKGDVVFSAL